MDAGGANALGPSSMTVAPGTAGTATFQEAEAPPPEVGEEQAEQPEQPEQPATEVEEQPAEGSPPQGEAAAPREPEQREAEAQAAPAEGA